MQMLNLNTVARRFFLSCLFISFVCINPVYAAIAAEYCPNLDRHETVDVQHYILNTWNTLTRTQKNLLSIAKDPKLKHRLDAPWVIYIPPTLSLEGIKKSIKDQMLIDDYNKIEIRTLPQDISKIKPHGLLYLPNSYVVPGGRFNEMYGWDSYFIILGLLENNRLALAKGMVDNFKFEIDYYGNLLNANRTYYLTRSQPPLFPAMILAVYNRTQDKQWLQSMLPSIKKYYRYWTTGPRLIPEIGLSRYYPDGEGPSFEVVHTANHLESTYYPQVKQYLSTHVVVEPGLRRFYNPKTDQLTSEFYKSDRAVRESGLDLSSKYGPFGVYITENISVALNSLLYKMEEDTAKIYKILGSKKQEIVWKMLAVKRKQLMDQYLWDEPMGYYLDYNFVTKQRVPHASLTSYYPLWVGTASKYQAKRLKINLINFEAKGGVVTSDYMTGQQWDAPFGWAPLHYFVVLGLNQYGYRTEAICIAKRFLALINANFRKHHTLFEKYNVHSLSANTEMLTQYGYNDNVVGFGWTNGVYLELLKFLDQYEHTDAFFQKAKIFSNSETIAMH
jgi:alpha,alpha-trehalase